MKTKEITIGGYYTAKISGRLTVVQIICTNHNGGWDAQNTKTGKTVRIRSSRKLRMAVPQKPDSTEPIEIEDQQDEPIDLDSQEPEPNFFDIADDMTMNIPDDEGPEAIQENLIDDDSKHQIAVQEGVAEVMTAIAEASVEQSDVHKEINELMDAREKTFKKMSALDATEKILKFYGRPMSSKDITDSVIANKLWTPQGKTPERTLYSSLYLHIKKAGNESRFIREGKMFSLRS